MTGADKLTYIEKDDAMLRPYPARSPYLGTLIFRQTLPVQASNNHQPRR